MRIWIKTDGTEYELPIAIADTSYELAKIVGVHTNTVRTGAKRARDGQTSIYQCVEVEE